MNSSLAAPIRLRAAQRGAVLIMALMFLTLLTLLGVTAMTNSTSEEKMARASRDYNTAFSAAEAALRDAETDLLGSGTRAPVFLGPAYWFDGVSNPSAPAAGVCVNGACAAPAAGSTPVWEVAANWNAAGGTGAAAVYGQFTSAQAFPTAGPGAVGQAPQYMIEYVGLVGAQSAYRITARGWGPNSVQAITLQEEVLR